jgi:hypothetical protein
VDFCPPLRNQEQSDANFSLREVDTEFIRTKICMYRMSEREREKENGRRCSKTSLASRTDDFRCFARLHANAVT